RAGWIAHMNSGERVMVQRVLYQHLNGVPFVTQQSGGPPKFDVTSDGARAFTELLANMAKDHSTSARMGEVTPVCGPRRGAMITHDAFSVFVTLVSTGQPGILDEQHTVSCFDQTGTKMGNLSRNYHFLVSSKSKYKDESWKFLRWMNDGPDYRMQKFQTDVFG